MNNYNCLYCKNAKCKNNCIIKTDIPNIIKNYNEGNLDKARQIVLSNNILASICPYVCDIYNNCYGNCILNKANKAIKYYELERELTRDYQFKVYNNINKNILIIGFGVSGIVLALKFLIEGFKVTIFEKNFYGGGLLTDGIPNSRLDYSLVKYLINEIERLNAKIYYNKAILYEDLDKYNDDYDYIFYTVGLNKTYKLDLFESPKILSALDIIKKYNLNEKLNIKNDLQLKGDIIIIGLGNVALDAARLIKNNETNVKIIYRRDKSSAPCSLYELEEVSKLGIDIIYLNKPVKVIDKNNKLVITFEITKTSDKIINGKKEIISTNEFINYECDYILEAIGQYKDDNNIYTKESFYKLDNSNIYLCGDNINKASSVVNVCKNATILANHIIEIEKNK